MGTLERSSAFKRDYRRAKSTPRHAKDIDPLLSAIVEVAKLLMRVSPHATL
jgi:hypothetical protein